jgi:excisionase family DNA binding protein
MFLHQIDMEQKIIIIDEKLFLEILNGIRTIKEALASQGKTSAPKKWLTTLAAAEILNVAVRTIYKYCQDGILHPHKVGGILLFDRSEIESLIQGK